ncbi:MAG: helix-turn-helix domain-containing protein [Alphaproteobacteria bacterium]|nr:helix-turn-helix domain-containing protein [Alphaproteobacteria bacterium]
MTPDTQTTNPQTRASRPASSDPHAVDIHVGRRVRGRRKAIGMTQDGLAASLGITFQQVQKYERGANRVSASKLFAISQALEVPIQWFFEGLETGGFSSPGASMADELMATAHGAELVADFVALNSAMQSAIAHIATELRKHSN